MATPRLNGRLDVTRLRVEGLPSRKYRTLIGAVLDHSEVGLADEAK
jgi:hypothetical protein